MKNPNIITNLFPNGTMFEYWYENNCLRGCKRVTDEAIEGDIIDGDTCPIENCLVADCEFNEDTMQYYELLCGGKDTEAYKKRIVPSKCAFYSDSETYLEYKQKRAIKKENYNLFGEKDETNHTRTNGQGK